MAHACTFHTPESERTAWYWKQQEKLRKATEKNLGRIAEELKK